MDARVGSIQSGFSLRVGASGDGGGEAYRLKRVGPFASPFEVVVAGSFLRASGYGGATSSGNGGSSEKFGASQITQFDLAYVHRDSSSSSRLVICWAGAPPFPGVQDTKLEIHGCDCQSYHAVLQTRFCIDDGFPSALEQQMVEFPVGNAEYVNQFLLQYSMLRMKEGFVLQHDSLQLPTDLGIGMNIGFDLDRFSGGEAACIPKQTGQSKMHQSSGSQSTDHNELSVIPVKPPKSNAAAQRERTGKLKMSDLAQFFHLPINAAAKELGICPTVLKKICRRNGMRRWPHRKIKSIERIIATLEQTIAEGAGQGDESIRMEIAMLKNERAQLCAGLLGET